MHRFVWDMRYPDAHGIEGGTYLAGGNLRGPVARPGHVSGAADGRRPDPDPAAADREGPGQPPRVTPTSRSSSICWSRYATRCAAAHDAVNRIRKLRADTATLRERAGTSRSARPVDAAAARLDAALSKVLNELAELRFAGFDDQMLVFDLKLNNRMAALQNYVAHGDYAPTDQQQAVFKEVAAAIDAQLASLVTSSPPTWRR